jgi:hypothetical protein
MAAFEYDATILNTSAFTAPQKGGGRFHVIGNGGNICAVKGGFQ